MYFKSICINISPYDIDYLWNEITKAIKDYKENIDFFNSVIDDLGIKNIGFIKELMDWSCEMWTIWKNAKNKCWSYFNVAIKDVLQNLDWWTTPVGHVYNIQIFQFQVHQTSNSLPKFIAPIHCPNSLLQFVSHAANTDKRRNW